MGLQRQVRANSIQIAWGVFRGFGAVLVLWLLSPTIFAFALWQLLSNAIYCFAARLGLWRALPSSPGNSCAHFEWRVFRGTWRYAAGMAGMAAVSTLLTQTDKLAVSKLLSLEMLGYYMLASALATVPLTLASPIASAVYPRLTGLVASGDSKGLIQLYHRSCEFVAVAVIPAGMTLALFAGEFIFAWTGSTIVAQRAAPAASLLLGHNGGSILFRACARQRQVESVDWHRLGRFDYTLVDCSDNKIRHCGRWVVVVDHESLHTPALHVSSSSPLYARRTSEMGAA
jgi:O-antigen/teichoic acid export membrane protein